MDEGVIRVLMIDDDEDDFVVTRDMLAEASEATRFKLDWVSTYEEGLEVIQRCEHDVYLVDYRLGGRSGLELLQEAIEGGCKAPLIIATGQGDHDIDLQAMEAGATDYLVKGQVDSALLERSIRYAIERRRIDQLRDTLIAFASHELRTPITAVKGYAQTALLDGTGALEETTVESLGAIIQAADHLTRLIDGFLDVSRVDAGRPIELVPEEFDIRGMVEEALEIQRMAARRSEFMACFEEGVSRLHGDRYKLLLVLTNLLANADKYSAGGMVRVHVATSDDRLTFRVEDEGIGIPAEALGELFTPFFRVRDPKQAQTRGAGLGLYLCKHLVEAHGGEISIESEVGKGTTVSLWVPRRP